MTSEKAMRKTHDRALRMTLDIVLPEGADEIVEENKAVAYVKALYEDREDYIVESVSARPMWREKK